MRADVDSAQKDALVRVVHLEHHGAAGCIVEREHDADVQGPELIQILAPIAELVGQYLINVQQTLKAPTMTTKRKHDRRFFV